MKFVFLSFYGIVLAGVNSLYSQTPANDQSWRLVWADEFNSSTLDQGNWCTQDERTCWAIDNPATATVEGHSFKAFRTLDPQNVSFVTGNPGYLRLTVQRQQMVRYNVSNCIPQQPNWPTVIYEYTAPRKLTSEHKFQYGFFEIRCRLPKLVAGQNNSGIGANFWLNWHDEDPFLNAYSEIDIVEYLGRPNTQYASLNTWYQSATMQTAQSEFTVAPAFHQFRFGSHTDGEWHRLAVSWTPDRIDFYRDDRHVYSSFHKPDDRIPMRMVLDFNVFTHREQPDGQTTFPYHFDVDYVRVYRLNTSQCNKPVITCDVDDIGPAVHRSIEVVGTCDPTVDARQAKVLRAVNGILMQPSFTVEAGATFVADITSCHIQKVHSCRALRDGCPGQNNCFTCRDCDDSHGPGGGGNPQ